MTGLGRKRFSCLILATFATTFLHWPSSILAAPDQDFVLQLVFIVDESGSMSGRQEWLIEALPALSQALDERNLDTPVDDLEFTLTGFTTNSRELIQRASQFDVARSVEFLRTDGGTEDGYAAIRDALDRHPEYADSATTIILITDEDRDASDASLTQEKLLDQLAAAGAVVHAIIPAEIQCPDRQRGIGLEGPTVALKPGVDGPTTCANARSATATDYSELAWATGGAVWDMTVFAARSMRSRSDRKPDPVLKEQIIIGLADRILAQWPNGPPWAQIDYWPAVAHVGDAVTFDGSRSFTNEPDRRIVEYGWDLDDDGIVDEIAPIVATLFDSPGRHRVVLKVSDDSMPAVIGRKIVYVEVSQ